MKLKQKTNKKFIEYFVKMARMYQGKEFEIAYSDIQRETGTASVTMKRAIQLLQESGVIAVSPGRNSRYGRFTYLKELPVVSNESSEVPEKSKDLSSEKPMAEQNCAADIEELHTYIDNLRRRVRSQEMAIALIQDRLAELEDKLFKR